MPHTQVPTRDTRCAILIPVYNNAKGLHQTLLTVFNAMIPNVDVVIVDDGSDVPPLANSEFLSKVTLIRLSKNSGIIQALNTGCQYCLKQGYDYIARLDAGDTVHPDRFRKQKALLDEQESLVLVTSWGKFTDEQSGKAVSIWQVPEGHEALVEGLRVQNIIIHPSVMLRLSALEKAGFYSTCYSVTEDYDLFLRLSAFGRYAGIPEVLSFYELRPSGISISKRRKQHLQRLKLQVIHFYPWSWRSYFGILRSAVALALPKQFALKSKRILGSAQLKFERK